jgi:large subunit ribosomal protein L17
MRHSNAGGKFSRTVSHRRALLRNLAKALLSHGRIRTTEVKAKALRGVVEPLITLALRNDLHARRLAYRVLGSHSLVKRLFDEIGPAFVGVPGGYTRVVKLAKPRKGDSAPLAVIELTRGGPGDKDAASLPGGAKAKPKTVKTKSPPAGSAAGGGTKGPGEKAENEPGAE